jgi:hypothetical protein
MVLDSILLDNLLNFVLEMHAIIGYHLVRDPITTYDVLLNKPSDMLCFQS